MPEAKTLDYQRLLESAPEPFLVLDPAPPHKILACTDAYLRAVGMDRSALTGRGICEVFCNEDNEQHRSLRVELLASLEKVLASRQAHQMSVQRYDLPAAGRSAFALETHFWRAENIPVLSAAGEVLYVMHRVNDVTQLELARLSESLPAELQHVRQMQESERKLRIYEAALSNTPDLVYVFDLDHRFTYANEALLKMWGQTREYALGKNCIELGYEPWHAAMHDREIDHIVATGESVRGEVPFNGTGGRRIYDYIFVPVVDADGKIVAVAGTTRDITERQRTEVALREQSEQLRAADRAKDEFFATLSHELRNPMAPLRNSISLLQLAGDTNATSAPVYEMMERQVTHLVRLVDELLETSRISRGDVDLRLTRVDVATIVRNATETVDPLIRHAGHKLHVTIPASPLYVNGDPVRLAQILSNLLNNAAKYTPDGGQITLTVREEGPLLAISVADNGLGIDADQLPRIFDMYSRGDRTSARAQGGLGIGLSLSRRLAELHGGSVHAYSDGRGKGSEFVVRLPHVPAEADEQTPREPESTRLEPTRVLVVDDNRDAANSLCLILQFLGADVRCAYSGREALEIFEEQRPSVVLLDIGMPGMSGYDVAKAIRSRFPDVASAIVALTGWGQDEDRRRTREAGFDSHLVKPVDLRALREMLATFASRQ